MAGFAALIGGAGQGAQQYGQQVRGLLEQRRSHFAELMSNLAQQEPNEQRRAEFLHHAADLYEGKPFDKIIPPAVKTLQTHAEGNDALSKMIGGPPKPHTELPGPAGPGQTPGTATQPAAQPSTSLTQPNSTPMEGGSTPIPPEMKSLPQAQIPPVGAASMQQPPTAQGQALPGMSLEDEMNLMRSSTPAMIQHLSPEWQASAQVRRQIESTQWMEKEYQRLVSDPQFMPGITDPMQRSMNAAVVLGRQFPIYGMASLNTPVEAPGLVSADKLPPGSKDIFGNPVDPKSGTFFRVQQDKVSHQPIGYIPVSPREAMGYNDQGQQMTVNPYATPGSTTGAVASSGIGPDPNGNTETYNRFAPPGVHTGTVSPSELTAIPGVNGGQAGFVRRGQPNYFHAIEETPYSLLAHKTDTTRPVQVNGPNGPATEFAPISTTRGAIVPGHAASGPVPPVGAGRTFDKPFTPEQSLTNEQQLNTITRAEGVMQRLRNNSHLMDSMIESGKLKLETGEGGLLRAVVAKGMNLTPAEAQFAGDFDTMAEDINLLRKPLGGAGFRSTEAWTALQGLKGSLLKNPEVTRRVMDNTLQAFEALRTPLASRSGGGVSPIPGAPVVVHSQADFDKLPKGAHFIEDGKELIKQ